MKIEFILDEGAYRPYKKYAGDAGFDLCVKSNSPDIILTDDVVTLINTGVHVSLPLGYVGYVQPRSSASLKGINVFTGTIDSGYVGAIGIMACAIGRKPLILRAGDRIAQLVIQPLCDVELQQAELMPETDRGNKGFGSTGR